MTSPIATLLAFGVPGWPEVAVIALLVLLFFGGKKIPELTKSLIQSAREIRKAVHQADVGDSAPGASEENVKPAEDKA